MAIEIVSFPIKNGGSFHSYVRLPEGNINVFRSYLRGDPYYLSPVRARPVSHRAIQMPGWEVIVLFEGPTCGGMLQQAT